MKTPIRGNLTRAQARRSSGDGVGAAARNGDRGAPALVQQGLRSLVAAAPVAITGCDLKGRVRLWNLAAERLFGFTEQEVMGRPMPITPRGQWREFLRRLARAAQGRGFANDEVRRRHKDGSLIDVLMWTTPWYNEHGRRVGAIAMMIDITERRRMEEAARAEQEFRKALENSVAAGIMVCDLEGRVTYANDAFCRMVGWKHQELLGRRPPYPFWPPEDRPRPRRIAEMILAGKAPRDGIELRIRHRNGRRFEAILFISPLRDSGGGSRGWVGCINDITDRKRAERALLESEKRYRGLVETQKDLIVRVNPQGNFTFVNEGYCVKAGKSRRQLLGKPFRPLVHPDDLAATLDTMKGLYEPPYRISVEQRMRTPSGYRWVSWEDATIFDEEGNIVEVQAIGRDIHARREAEEQIRLYQEQLRSMGSELAETEERERRRIATDLHDDIGQALALAQLKIEEMRSTCPSASHEQLDQVGQILSHAIQSTRNLTYQLSPPILYDLGLEAALEWLADQLRAQYGLQVVLRRPEGPPVRLSEPVRVAIFRAVRELLINVAKHAEVWRAEVRIARHHKAGQVVVTVSDDGVGFDPAGATAPATRGKKRGFGLFSIRERLDHLGGSMKVQSKPGGGTCVWLTAPLAPAEHGVRERAAGANARAANSKARADKL